METFSALLALCARNSPVPGEFPAQRPVTRSFDVFFDLRPNRRLSKQPRGWWFETPSWSLWRQSNAGFNWQVSFGSGRGLAPIRLNQCWCIVKESAEQTSVNFESIYYVQPFFSGHTWTGNAYMSIFTIGSGFNVLTHTGTEWRLYASVWKAIFGSDNVLSVACSVPSHYLNQWEVIIN